MSFNKLEIRDGKLYRDNVLFGSLMTHPPAEISATTQTSEAEDVLKAGIHWKATRCHEASSPLEILRVRLEEFQPLAAFIAGRKYELAKANRPYGKKLRFPYNTYYKFRICAPPPYDAALYSKMPLACWQARDRAFAMVFPKFLKIGQANVPVFIKTSGVAETIDFSVAILNEFEVKRKPFGWFGARANRETYTFALTQAESFEADFLMVSAETWIECIQACSRHLYPQVAGQIAVDSLADMVSEAMHFYNRVWDDRNRTHVHLPIKNVPRFESVEFKHSHITDDLTKLVLYRKLIQMGRIELAEREEKLVQKLAGGSYCYRMGESQLWHTTTYFNANDLAPFTHHGVGFVGFPGGMATVVRRLYEYCSLGPANTQLENLAQSGADWLTRTQDEDGSWPARIEEGKSRIRGGCIASSAEASRALVAAHVQTEKPEYRSAVEAAIRFINREQSFFECRRYLRDVDPNEADGITAETCIHANLDWFALCGDDQILEQAKKWGFYALQWVRPPLADTGGRPSFDGLSETITPRIDVWGELLVARAFMRLSQTTGDAMWRNYAWQLFANVASLRERDGGLCETWFLDFPSGLESIHIEPTFVADAFVEFILDAYQRDERSALTEALSRQHKHPPLESSAATEKLVDISENRPEFIIDGTLRLNLIFDGGYDIIGRSTRTAYTTLRKNALGRKALKLAPAAKILLSLHRVKLVRSRISNPSTQPKRFAVVNSDDGRRTYRASLHDITCSIVSEGTSQNKESAADIEMGVKTLAGDVRVNQVRIDLCGQYEIQSVMGKNEFVVSSGGNTYSFQVIGGSIDGIIRDGDRLALDISLSANWNFFGTYRLRLRVERRQERQHQ